MSARESHRAFVSLGSNLARPDLQVTRALACLAELPCSRLLARSSLYRTAPVGYLEQPDFINAVALLETGLGPRALLDALLGLERAFGRERHFRNAPRTLDLDLLLYDDLVHHEPGLTLPHPRMHERAFVLAPLVEIAPDLVIPGRGAAREWLARCLHQDVTRIAA